MPVEIDSLETHVDVMSGHPPRAAGLAQSGAPLSATGAGMEGLVEALRPLIRKILLEELQLAMRARGVR